MGDLLSDLEGLDAQLETAGAAAFSFRAVIAGIPGAVAGAGEAVSALAGKALQAATGYDASAGRFRAANGQFQTASSVASGAFQGAMNKIGSAGKEAAGAIKDLGGVVKTLASGDLPSAKDAMKAVGTVLAGVVTSGADKAAAALKTLGPEGEAAGVALQGLAAVLAATIGLLTTFMGLAIEGAQKLDLMRDRFAALAGSAAGGKAVQAMLANLNLPFASSEVNAWAQSLLGAGMRGKELEQGIRAVASAAALMGEQGGRAAQEMLQRLGEGGAGADELLKGITKQSGEAKKKLADMGLSLADLGGKAAVAKMSADQLRDAIAKALVKKGAGPLADMALTLPVILQKAREGFLSLFNGASGAVKVFMTAVKGLFGEFNKGSPLIKGLKPVVTDVLTTLFGWATKGINVIRSLVKEIVGAGKGTGVFAGALAVLKAGWSALVTIWNTVTTVLGPVVSLLKAVFSNALVVNGIKTIFTLLAAAIVVVVAAFGAFVGVVGTIAGVVAGAIGALAGLAAGALGAAADFVGGLVDGIAAGGGAVTAAVARLAQQALAGFKGILGIASHSKVLKKHGDADMAGAVAAGVDKGSDKAKDAMARMGDKVSGTGAKVGGKGGGDGKLAEHIHFHYAGPADQSDDFFSRAANWLDQLGAESPGRA